MMKTTKANEAAKSPAKKRDRFTTALTVAGWVSLILGAILFSLGLWKSFHAESGPLVATYRDEGVYVTASYGEEAKLPKDAQLRVRLVTPEADPDAYSRKMQAAMAVLGREGETAPANVIYNMGFFVGDEEIEPAAPVEMTVQILRDGFAVGEPIHVVHLGDNGAQFITDTSVDDDGCISFAADGFSDFGFLLIDGALGGSDLSDSESGFIVDAQLRDKNGNPLGPDDSIVLGEKYAYWVKFSENDAHQFENPMHFQLPEGFAASPVTGQPITRDGVTIGSYSIDENGMVTFNMDEDYLKEHDDVWLDVTFNLTAEEAAEGGGVDFPWKGGDVRHYGTEGHPEVQLAKKAGDYDPLTHTVDYAVTLDVTQGVVDDTVITDAMESGVSLYVDENGDPIGCSIVVTDESGRDITPDPPPRLVKTENGWTTEGLPSPLRKGQKVEIQYKAVVDYDENGAKVPLDPGETSFHYAVDNTVSVDGKGAPGGDPEVSGTKTATEKKTVDDKMLQKDGSQGAGNTIDWEILVGSGAFDVRGKTLTDTVGEGQWVDTSKPLEFKWKDVNDSTIKTLNVTWEMNEDGTVDTEAMKAKGITNIVTNAEGKITGFEVTIPDAENEFWDGISSDKTRDWREGDWVKIEYFTAYDPPADGSRVPYTNHVTGYTEALPDGVTGHIVIGTGGIQKDLTQDRYNAEGDYIEYTITVRVPAMEQLQREAGGDKAKEIPYFYIQDQLEFPEGHVELYDEKGNKINNRFYVDNIPEITAFKAVGAESGEIDFEKLDDPCYGQPGHGHTYYVYHDPTAAKSAREFQIWFNTPLTSVPDTKDLYHNSLWDINEDVTLTITYRVPGSSRLLMQVGDGEEAVETGFTLRDLLERGSRLDNEVWGRFRVTSDDKKLTSENQYTKTPSEPSLSKQAELLADNVIQYTVRFDNVYRSDHIDHDLHLFDEKELEDFRFVDSFDSEMEYVQGSLEVVILKEDGTLRGTFTTTPESEANGSLFFCSDDGSTTTLTAFAAAFDNPIQGVDESGLYKQASLYEWLKTYQNPTDKTKDSRYIFRYQLRIKGEYLTSDELTLDNTAHVMYGTHDLFDKEQIKTKPDVLNKSSELLKTEDDEHTINQATYTITVNPGGANLAVGTAEDGSGTYDLERYKLIDTMGPGLIPDWSTVKIEYECVRDGETVKGELKKVADETDVTLDSFSYVGLPDESGMTFVVPDQLKLTITYTVTLDTTNYGQDFHASNTVAMEGNASIADQNDTIFQVDVNTATTGASDKIRLYKRDAATGHMIDGAEFTLYRKTGEGPGSVQLTADLGDTIELKEAGVYKPSSSADESGLPGTSIPRSKDESDVYYVLVETKAPGGYEPDPTPIVFRFGKTPDTGAEQVRVTAGGKTYDVTVKYYTSGGGIFVDNTPIKYVLPETGGNGVSVYAAAGLALMLGSGLVLLAGKRPRRTR